MTPLSLSLSPGGLRLVLVVGLQRYRRLALLGMLFLEAGLAASRRCEGVVAFPGFEVVMAAPRVSVLFARSWWPAWWILWPACGDLL